jgi:HEPN domain-containing protein
VAIKLPEEWFKQERYDYDTAKAMFEAGRYIYTVFMCHLSIEKALEGLFAKNIQKNPPKTHDLNYLCKIMDMNLPDEFQSFVGNLNDLSVPTRYPDEIEKLVKQYNKSKTSNILKLTQRLLSWLKENT